MLRKLARRVRNKIAPKRYGLEYADLAPFEGERTYAFLCGCGRSGTTALTELVNRHQDIAIGYERFAQHAIAGTLSPDLFTPERFADFQENDTFRKTYAGDPIREKVVRKFHAARVVGDKVPTLFRNLDQLDSFEDPKVIFIVREPFAVAQSFVARARNVEDKGWALEHDHRAAVAEFNEALQAIQAYVATGKPALVLEYAGLFLRKEGFDALWEFLDVDSARLEDTGDIFEKARRSEEKRWINAIGGEVSRNADLERFREVLKLCPRA